MQRRELLSVVGGIGVGRRELDAPGIKLEKLRSDGVFPAGVKHHDVVLESPMCRVYETLIPSYSAPVVPMTVLAYTSDPPFQSVDNCCVANISSATIDAFAIVNGITADYGPQRQGLRKLFVEAGSRLIVRFQALGDQPLPAGREYQIRGRCFESSDVGEMLRLYREF